MFRNTVDEIVSLINDEEPAQVSLSELNFIFKGHFASYTEQRIEVPHEVYAPVLEYILGIYNTGSKLQALCVYMVFCEVVNPKQGHYLQNGKSIHIIDDFRSISLVIWPNVLLFSEKGSYNFITGTLPMTIDSWVVIMSSNLAPDAFERNGGETKLWDEKVIDNAVKGVLRSDTMAVNISSFLVPSYA